MAMVLFKRPSSWIPALLFCVIYFNCTSENELKTGIEGQMLRGPLAPGPQLSGMDGYDGYKAEFTVTDRDGRMIQKFSSDNNGQFKVILPIGLFMIIPESNAPIMEPQGQIKIIEVTSLSFTEVQLYFDTGIR